MSDSHKTAEIVAAPAPVPTSEQRMHPLVDAVRSKAAELDPATLRELLAVQREWEADEARKAYTRALARLKQDLPTVIGRDQEVDYTNTKGRRTYYTHTSLAQVMDAVTEPLTRHGFSLNWVPAITERSVLVTCRLTHTEGHSEESTLSAPPDTSGSKNPAQAIASTVTLLQRYTALSLLGIATADMREPTGQREQADDAIDPRRNLTAVRALSDAGITREQAEERIGRPVSQWTKADRLELRAWLDELRGAAEDD